MNIWLGEGPEGKLELSKGVLLRHTVALGASGSGKTVISKVVCEEVARQGIPIIAVDPQGDIASLALLAEPSERAAHEYLGPLCQQLSESVEVLIWTPGSTKGLPLSANPLGTHLSGKTPEETVRVTSLTARTVAAMLGYDAEGKDGRSVEAFLTVLLESLREEGTTAKDLAGLREWIDRLPGSAARRAKGVISEKTLADLKKRLEIAGVGASRLVLQMGVPIDIDLLLGRSGAEGKTRISVIYLNTLASQEEKEFFLAVLAQRLYLWMLAHPSRELQALFYIDEVAPFLPPVRKPACKDALMMLFKQGRKYGVGCLAATQNPGDVDYKALGQCSTWFLGRLLTRQDIAKVANVIKAISPKEEESIVQRLPALEPGQFLALCPDEFGSVQEFRVRRLATRHATLDEEQVAELMKPVRDAVMAEASAARQPEGEEAAEKPEGAPAVAAAELPSPGDISAMVEDLLLKAGRSFTLRELARELSSKPGEAGDALHRLREAGKVHERQVRGARHFWHSGHLCLPHLGHPEAVRFCALRVSEFMARELAEDHLEGFLWPREQVAEMTLVHLPLWQVRLRAKTTGGWLFWKTVEKLEHVYLHGQDARVLVWDEGGFRFCTLTRDDPVSIRDLDELEPWADGPAQAGYDTSSSQAEHTSKNLLPKGRIRAWVKRKFLLESEGERLVFLPCWRFQLVETKTKESRTLELDGILGRPLK